jgi:hypothetical protein
LHFSVLTPFRIQWNSSSFQGTKTELCGMNFEISLLSKDTLKTSRSYQIFCKNFP